MTVNSNTSSARNGHILTQFNTTWLTDRERGLYPDARQFSSNRRFALVVELPMTPSSHCTPKYFLHTALSRIIFTPSHSNSLPQTSGTPV